MDALITALAGLLGVLVGGGVTLRVERERREGERARDAEREAAAARGIARVTSARFGDAIVLCRSTLDQRLWWPLVIGFLPPLPLEDRKLLYSLLPTEQWVALDKAEHAMTMVQRARGNAVDDTPSEDARGVLEQALERLDAGQKAVKELVMS